MPASRAPVGVGSRASRVPLLVWLAWLLCLATTAHADGSLGADGEPITTSTYAVDFTRGPVLSSSRATGLAGAITAIAEGAEGGLSNPAAVAARYTGSVDWFDYWLAFGFTYPVENGDFFNSGGFLDESGEIPDTGFTFFNPGFYLQFGRFALGLDLDIQSATAIVAATDDAEASELHLFALTNHVQLGWLFWDGQLSLGGGLMVLRQVVSGGTRRLPGTGNLPGGISFPGTPDDKLFSHTGVGGELGVLLRPNGEHWRLGASIFSTVRTDQEQPGDTVVQGKYVPEFAERPWQGNLAFAYQFGGRPLNPRFAYVEEYAHADLAAIEAREQADRIAHEARSAELRARGGPGAQVALAREAQKWIELQAMHELERATVRKLAWRELRGRVRTGWPRRYALITGELSFTGRVSEAVGVESFLLQTVQRSGEKITVTPRFAVESELWPGWLRARTGIYLEPARFEQSMPRVHGTLGIDVRALHWDVFRIWPEDYLWQVTLAGDISVGYVAFSVGFGGWY